MTVSGATFSLDQLAGEEGYTGPVPLLTPDEAAAGRSAFFETIGQPEDAPGPADFRPGGFNLEHRWAHDLATHERVLDHVELALGRDIVLWATVFWYKEPHNTKYIPWHQDASYWPMEPRINLTAWIALGPTFSENGCLRLIPGSHKAWLDDDYKESGRAERVLARAGGPTRSTSRRPSTWRCRPARWSSLARPTLHGSNANVSDVPRVAYSLRFTTPEVRFDPEGLKEQRIDYLTRTFLVRGEDRYGLNDSAEGGAAGLSPGLWLRTSLARGGRVSNPPLREPEPGAPPHTGCGTLG